MLAPPAVRPGCVIRVVAPSGTFPAEAFHAGVRRLRKRYDVRFDQSIFERSGYFAGTDARRAGELQRAIEDPDARAIVAARGGYGCTRLLSLLDTAAIACQPKLLVGFSDLTALHVAWSRAGVR